mgnify:CR=1 FL=1|jgi:hypothetical protein|nr:MAG TPA: hypothetical protein [Caudoviricetes sp.]
MATPNTSAAILFKKVFKGNGVRRFSAKHGIYLRALSSIKTEEEFLRLCDRVTSSSDALNSSFYKSWEEVKKRTKQEKLFDRITHYISTYGSDFLEEPYIPIQQSVLPMEEKPVEIMNLIPVSPEEMLELCKTLTHSGIALSEDTLNHLKTILFSSYMKDMVNAEFVKEVKNRELKALLMIKFNIAPSDYQEFLSMYIYLLTGKTLVIKDRETITAIKESSYNPLPLMESFGFTNIAKYFLSDKKFFLPLKQRDDRALNKAINKIRKLSKTFHTKKTIPLLQQVTKVRLEEDALLEYGKDKVFQILRARQAIDQMLVYLEEGTVKKSFKIRNGKTFVKRERKLPTKQPIPHFHLMLLRNRRMIDAWLMNNYNFAGRTFYIPRNIEYNLPTSEKSYIGNIPYGTTLYLDDLEKNSLIMGVQWFQDEGAKDLDFSCIGMDGEKVGWNTLSEKHFHFSGDMTTAPREKGGATEFVMSKPFASDETFAYLAYCNLYSSYVSGDYSYRFLFALRDNNLEAYKKANNRFDAKEKALSILGGSKIVMETKITLPHNQPQIAFGTYRVDEGHARFIFGTSNIGGGRVSYLSKDTKELQIVEELSLNAHTGFRVSNFIELCGGEVIREEPISSDQFREGVEYTSLAPEALTKTSFIELLK